MAHDVFVSYSSKDKATADAVCAVLESHGIRCWVAPRDILPGRDWGGSIIQAIKGARAMVLVFSAKANSSAQIKREVERAVNEGIPVIPLRIEDVAPTDTLEYFISTPHWLDAFTPPLEIHLQYLAKVVKEILVGPAATVADAEKSEAQQKDKRHPRHTEKQLINIVVSKHWKTIAAFALPLICGVAVALWYWAPKRLEKSETALQTPSAYKPANSSPAPPIAPSSPVSVATPFPGWTSGIQVLQATYGAGTQQMDVTAKVQSLVQSGQTNVRVGNHLFGKDPIFGQPKTLSIVFTSNGVQYRTDIREGEQLSFSNPHQSAISAGSASITGWHRAIDGVVTTNAGEVTLSGPGDPAVAVLDQPLTEDYTATGEVLISRQYAGFVLGFEDTSRTFVSVYASGNSSEYWKNADRARTSFGRVQLAWPNKTWAKFVIQKVGSQVRITVDSSEATIELPADRRGSKFGLIEYYGSTIQLRNFQVTGPPAGPLPPITSQPGRNRNLFDGTWVGTLNGHAGFVQFTLIISQSGTVERETSRLGSWGPRYATNDGKTMTWYWGIDGKELVTFSPNPNGNTAVVTSEGPSVRGMDAYSASAIFRRVSR